MLPISPCNTAGARLLLALALLLITSMTLTPSPGIMQQTVNDKFGHLLAFYVLALFTHASWPQLHFGWRQVLALTSYGLAIETAQYFIPNRFFSLLDVLADMAGIGLYMLSIPLVVYLFRTFSPSKSELPEQVK